MAGIIYLLSNNSDVPLTPDGLRKLAQVGEARAAEPEVPVFQVHRLSARLEADAIDEIVRRYEAGASARSLASQFGIAPSALLRLLRERHVVVRPRFVSQELAEEMGREYGDGMTMVELEEKHGLSHNAVMRALHGIGVEMRGRGRRKSV